LVIVAVATRMSKTPWNRGKTGGRLWFHAQSELREGENY
jgi:hypothetical protein